MALAERQEPLATYNQTNQTNYVAFPASTFAFSQASVSIASGSLNAATPFVLPLRNTCTFVPGRRYLLSVGNAATGWHSALAFGILSKVTFTLDMLRKKDIRGGAFLLTFYYFWA